MRRREAIEIDVQTASAPVKVSDKEGAVWCDGDAHTLFDTCVDDHRQRYRGIIKATSPHVEEAIRVTRGQLLMNGREIYDVRFSKHCGGVSEEYEYCWDNNHKPYSLSIVDNAPLGTVPTIGLTDEAVAREQILSSPEALCSAKDVIILGQALNNYDQETQDSCRWAVGFTQSELAELIRRKNGLDFGEIIDFQPSEHGKSGRTMCLKIVGMKFTRTIGKKLEIRHTLSESYLYSSALVVERSKIMNDILQYFRLVGVGWGHGVGSCQVGAAVMSEKDYQYDGTLHHYYQAAAIEAQYK